MTIVDVDKISPQSYGPVFCQIFQYLYSKRASSIFSDTIEKPVRIFLYSCAGTCSDQWINKVDKKQNIHLNMDTFYPSIEILDNPELKGKPVIMGRGKERGAISSASYEAHKYLRQGKIV